MPTLRQLNVQPGDVVKTSNGTILDVAKIDASYAYGTTTWSDGVTVDDDIWTLDSLNTWQIVSRSSDSPKPWNEMTDDEKAPILLAWARGEEVEYLDDDRTWQSEDADPRAWDVFPRRIKPKQECVDALIHWDDGIPVGCYDLDQASRLVDEYGGHIYRITRNEDGSDPQIEKVEV